MTKKRLTVFALAATLFCGAFYLCCGLFIVHPLGAIPGGSTHLYWRIGTDLPFISSADGLLLQQEGSATPATRGAALSQTSNLVLQRRILKLPYSRQLYLLSTGGVDLDRRAVRTSAS